MPAHWKDYQISWIVNHPSYEYRLWTDEENRRFLEKHYPWFIETYDALPESIMRADAMRPFYLYHYGGIYADLDYECYQCMDNIIDYYSNDNYNVLLARQMVGDRASNYLMMSEAGHPFWLKVIDRMQKRVKRKWWQTRMLYLWNATGPNVINHVYAENDWDDVLLLDDEHFNPQTPSIDKVMYGKHHETQSWGDDNSDRVLAVIHSLRKMKSYAESLLSESDSADSS